jgi:hypothetical protein
MKTRYKKIKVRLDASTWRWLRALTRNRSENCLGKPTARGGLQQAAFRMADCAGRRQGAWTAEVARRMLESSGYATEANWAALPLLHAHDRREQEKWRDSRAQNPPNPKPSVPSPPDAMIRYVFRRMQNGKRSAYCTGRYAIKCSDKPREAATGLTDKAAALAFLDKFVVDEQRAAVSILPERSYREAAQAALADLLADYTANIRARCKITQYANVVDVRVGEIIREAKWSRLADVPTGPHGMAHGVYRRAQDAPRIPDDAFLVPELTCRQ